MTAKSVSKKCSVDGCNRDAIKRGMCDTDYHRLRRTPEYQNRINRGVGSTPEQRFWSRVALTADDQRCWEWQAGTGFGYGVTTVNGKITKAHRAAWFYVKGEMPKLFLLHSCDNRKCVNPNHLREGTSQDNVDDMKSRNRQAKGESTNRTRLTASDVLEIRRRFKPRVVTTRMLADEYGLGMRTVFSIIHRETWRHLP